MMALDGDIKIPGAGELPKKYVLGAVAVSVGIVVIVYVRKKKSAASSASTASTATGALVTDPAGNQCATLDPNSGYCPGSPEDTAYQAQSTGSYSGLGYGGGIGYPGVSSAGLVTDPAGNQCAAVDPATGYCPGTPEDTAAGGTTGAVTTGTGATGATVSTNSDWLQEALSVVPGNSSTVQTALASVLGGLTVTTAQKNLFLEAVGILGQPPQGYPQPIKTSDTSAHPAAGAKAAGAISNLAATPNASGFTAHWNPAPNVSQGYAWQVTGGGITKSDTTKSTSVSVGGLKAKTVYNFGIQALPGGPGNNIHVTTTLWP